MKKITMNQISGMNMNFQYYTLDYALDHMEKLGITKLELYAGSPHFYAEDISLNDVRTVKNKIFTHGMTLVCYTPEGLFYPYNAASENESLRKRTIKYLKKNIELASEVESPYMLVLAGRSYYNENPETAWKRAVDSLAIVADYAQKLGITLLLEPLQYTEANLIIKPQDALNMIEEVGSSSLATMIDTVQMVSSGSSIKEFFDIVGKEKVKHIHLTDGEPTGHLAPGDGNLPLDKFIHDIEETGYEGNITLEIGPYLENPVPAWERGIAYVRNIIEQ